jgi:hypothetical protein
MAKLSELIRGFRANVRNGIPSTLMFREGNVHLTAEMGMNGYVGLCRKPTTNTTPKGGKINGKS